MNHNVSIGIATLPILVALVVATSFLESKNVFAQALTENFAQTTKWTKFFNSTEWKSPFDSQRIFVLYESDKTVLMTSEYPDLLFNAVDFVKADGFKVDDLIEYETGEENIYGDVNVVLNFMVAMSKE
jgi:hypothetical protein